MSRFYLLIDDVVQNARNCGFIFHASQVRYFSLFAGAADVVEVIINDHVIDTPEDALVQVEMPVKPSKA
ncbi:MAG: hypothetical protein HFF18_04955 [Oscillospiraceae bacterium]|nr:hypothetical protein [Oscillospiraceae bacterium]